ncbi:MAG TPA: hypothetical protein PKM35_12485 [Holophaga sp.]|nr:hypothetical protein [Holophaga sp.]
MRLLIRFVASLFLGLALSAQAPGFMPLQAVRPGMKGQGRTVFRGGRIEKFDFEVLGVLRNGGGPLGAPGRSLILVKASGGPLADTGIIAGMSGSPCYIDGRLAGALSISFPYEKEPIGGITPIAEMLDQLQDIPDTPALRTPLVLPKLEVPDVLKSAMAGTMLPAARLMGCDASVPEGGQLLPLPVAGPELSGEVKALWEGLPFRFLGTGLASGNGGEASPLEPGGMVALSLVRGDLELGTGGTITYVSGKRVFIFGHQLMNLGSVDLPLWSATVGGILPSYLASTKLAMPVAPIGAVRLDRSAGVAGILGAEAKMIPLRVGLNLGGKRALNFRFDLMDHPVLTPLLAATVISQTLNTNVRGLGFQSLAMQGNLKLAGHPAILLENMVADLNSDRMARYVGALLQAVTLNPFERPVIEGISLTIKAEERLDLTAIAGVRTLKARARRGEVLPVLVTLQNVQGVREYATFNVDVPPSAVPGKATLLVGDGASLLKEDPDERVIEVNSLADIVRLLNGALRNNHAYSLLVQSQPGAGLRGSRIEGVTPTVASLLGGDGNSTENRLQRRIIGKAVLPLEREVSGLVSLELEIE